MPRGLPTKKALIGHSLYGVINKTKYKWFTSIKDPVSAQKYAEELGMINSKTYPIYKDEPI